jgi:hypothetical protein
MEREEWDRGSCSPSPSAHDAAARSSRWLGLRTEEAGRRDSRPVPGLCTASTKRCAEHGAVVADKPRGSTPYQRSLLPHPSPAGTRHCPNRCFRQRLSCHANRQGATALIVMAYRCLTSTPFHWKEKPSTERMAPCVVTGELHRQSLKHQATRGTWGGANLTFLLQDGLSIQPTPRAGTTTQLNNTSHPPPALSHPYPSVKRKKSCKKKKVKPKTSSKQRQIDNTTSHHYSTSAPYETN